MNGNADELASKAASLGLLWNLGPLGSAENDGCAVGAGSAKISRR